ncbi:ABC transporter substrate-binding protein, partial [Azotobacter beijerinckii]|uniref:ABC transporter substrate-binding protein n=1 Tax=Azotobacter beijerinckii TaxID=170623 RepID=UPI0029551259
AAGLADPLGAFRVFATIPFVWLIDRRRLKGRRPPRVWSDLLDPQWAGEIVFGGWRPNPQVPYQDYNAYLLLALYLEFGRSGLATFAGNVRHLQHNVRTATQAGSNSPDVGAIAVLPWLQAELCPRRERTSVVWPEDGALAMPIGYLLKPGQEERLAPLIDYLHGAPLGAVLARNCYPPTGAAHAQAFPPGARLKWPGWAFFRTHDFAAEQRRAAELFFAAGHAQGGLRLCN